MEGFHYEELTEGSYPGFLLGVRAFAVFPTASTVAYNALYTDPPSYGYSVEFHSPAQAHTWRPGVNTARCLRWSTISGARVDRHDAPGVNCNCGFYAYGRTEHAAEFAHYQSRTVIGVVKATGRIIVGDRGMRAQYMEIAGLIKPATHQTPHISMGNEEIERNHNWWDQAYAERQERLRRLYELSAPQDEHLVNGYQVLMRATEQPYPWFDSIEEAVETIRKVT